MVNIIINSFFVFILSIFAIYVVVRISSLAIFKSFLQVQLSKESQQGQSKPGN